MSKLVVIGDIHGKTIWEDIIYKEQPDKVIFLGDYVTSHDNISPDNQLRNLLEILALKEYNPNDTILLRGNHDIDMLGYYWAECYPLEPKVKQEMSKDPLKSRFLNLTQWIYIDEELKTVFSHAGISEYWLDHISGIKSIYDINNQEPSVIFGFWPDSLLDTYGDSKTQPPTWIRPPILCKYNIKDWDQVIGHTRTCKGIVNVSKAAKYNQNIWLCDTLEDKEYLVINNGEFISAKL